MAIYRQGRKLEGEEAEKALAKHNAIMERHRRVRDEPFSGMLKPVTGSGGGSKGGKGSIDPRTQANQNTIRESQNDGSYGYYNDMGRYIPFSMDIRDGGGMNTSGNYFKGGGPLSSILNVAKVRPAGAAREKVDGEYVVPREQIGFRNIDDMTDRGGPQASGGEYEGAGSVSAIFNMADRIGRATIPERQPYVYDENGVFKPRTIFNPRELQKSNTKMSIIKKLLGG